MNPLTVFCNSNHLCSAPFILRSEEKYSLFLAKANSSTFFLGCPSLLMGPQFLVLVPSPSFMTFLSSPYPTEIMGGVCGGIPYRCTSLKLAHCFLFITQYCHRIFCPRCPTSFSFTDFLNFAVSSSYLISEQPLS